MNPLLYRLNLGVELMLHGMLIHCKRYRLPDLSEYTPIILLKPVSIKVQSKVCNFLL